MAWHGHAQHEILRSRTEELCILSTAAGIADPDALFCKYNSQSVELRIVPMITSNVGKDNQTSKSNKE